MSNFKDAIQKNKPKILHISCHGVCIKEEKFKPNIMSLNSDEYAGQYLLFENSWCDGELVSAQSIHRLIRTRNHELDLVFVAACDSKSVGEIF